MSARRCILCGKALGDEAQAVSRRSRDGATVVWLDARCANAQRDRVVPTRAFAWELTIAPDAAARRAS